MSGNGIATNVTASGSPPSARTVSAAATWTMELIALTATVLPSRSAGRVTSDPAGTSSPEASSSAEWPTFAWFATASSGTTDVGIVACADPDALARNLRGELHAVRSRELPLIAALPPRLAAAGAAGGTDAGAVAPVDLRDFEGERWMIPRYVEGFPGLPELVDEIWARPGIRPAMHREVATLQTAIPLIAAGTGVALMPEAIRRIAQDTVALRPVVQELPPLFATVLWSADGAPTPAARLFLELAIAGAGADA